MVKVVELKGTGIWGKVKEFLGYFDLEIRRKKRGV
jgi:hypothetical protein